MWEPVCRNDVPVVRRTNQAACAEAPDWCGHRTTKEKRGCPPKKWEKHGEGYQSVIAWYLAANKICCERSPETDFRVLTHGCSQLHLNVIEPLYTHFHEPVLCVQKFCYTSYIVSAYAHTQLALRVIHESTTFKGMRVSVRCFASQTFSLSS